MNSPEKRNAISWRETRSRLRADRRRWAEYGATIQARFIPIQPGFLAVFFYRLSHYCFDRGYRLLARALWHLNVFLTGADIAPISKLGGGCLLLHPAGITIVCSAGENLTIEGSVSIGGGVNNVDIGAGPGLPMLGDRVTIGFGSSVLGSISIGSGVCIGHHCLVTEPLADAAVVEPAPTVVRTGGKS